MQLSLLRAIKAHTIFLLSFVLLFTTGCEDDDHDNHDHGHTDADGFILESNGTEIYREFEGSVTGSCLLYTSPSPRDMRRSRMPSSA